MFGIKVVPQGTYDDLVNAKLERMEKKGQELIDLEKRVKDEREKRKEMELFLEKYYTDLLQPKLDKKPYLIKPVCIPLLPVENNNNDDPYAYRAPVEELSQLAYGVYKGKLEKRWTYESSETFMYISYDAHEGNFESKELARSFIKTAIDAEK